MADHEPEAAQRVAAVCLPHDYLTWRIAGGFERLGLEGLATDRSDASGTGYVDRSGSAYRRDILTQALHCSEERAESIVLPRIANRTRSWRTGTRRAARARLPWVRARAITRQRPSAWIWVRARRC